jgi:PII-like signaling protein
VSEHLKLVVHHGERARSGGRLTGDAVMEAVAGARAAGGVAAAVALRGVEGFGAHHRLRTDRLLTLSDDLPLVTLVVGPAAAVAPLATAVAELVPSGLLTLERVALPGLGLDDDLFPAAAGATAKLTVVCGRGAVRAVAGVLEAEGADAVTALVGVDGVLAGRRRRASALGAGRDVPAAVIAVGAGRALTAALPRVRAAAGPHVPCLERVNVVRRAGAAVGPLPVVPERDAGGLGLWQRVLVAVGAEDRVAHRLVRDLRAAGCAGATALRGASAVLGDRRHEERAFALRRRAPFHLTIVETPSAVRRLFPAIKAATARDGLVTCETLPAVRIHPATGRRTGGLRLAATR